MLHHEIVPLTPLQQLAGRHTQQSLAQSAQSTLHTEVEVDPRMDARVGGAPDATLLPVNPHVLHAVALALKEHPWMNAHLVGEELAVYHEVNVGVMMGREDGVIAPVVRDAASKPVRVLAGVLHDLMEEARNGHFKLEDMRSATFVVADLSAYGIDAFTPILPLGKVGALGVGRTRTVYLPTADGPRTAHLMTLSLTFDHRATDGIRAARFLAAVAEKLAAPALV